MKYQNQPEILMPQLHSHSSPTSPCYYPLVQMMTHTDTEFLVTPDINIIFYQSLSLHIHKYILVKIVWEGIKKILVSIISSYTIICHLERFSVCLKSHTDAMLL